MLFGRLFVFFILAGAGEDANQRNNITDTSKWGHVIVGRTLTRRRGIRSAHHEIARTRGVDFLGSRSPKLTAGGVVAPGSSRNHQVGMRRKLLRGQSDLFQ